MKILSLKILGCAAAFALLTTTRAQTSDDDVQAVPPPDTNVQSDTTSVQQGQPANAQPNVIVVPMPTEALDTNSDAGVNGAPGNQQNIQSLQNGQQGQPNQFRGTSGSNQYGGRNFDRGNYDRNNRGRNGRDSGQQRLTAGPSDPGTFMPPSSTGTNGTDGLIMNFRGAQIDQVLNYLSDAAGFIIELDTPVRGTVDVFSAQPVSKDEAVQLLNSVLNKNGYAAIRDGRRLRIMTKDNAMRGQIPVIIGNDPANIPMNDEIVTQIIPIRYVQARQLIIDLSSLTQSPSIIANDAGNSIIVTDTQANIHHLVELVKAIDGSAEDVTVVKPFHLQYHDPVEVATLITSVYADQSNGQGGGQAPIRFGGFGGGAGGFGGFGGFGGRGGGQGGGGGLRALFGGGQQGGQQGGQAVRQKAKVVAVADQRTASVIVTAPKDLMPQIEELVTQIDQDSPKIAKVSVIHLENADPIQVQKVLQQFQGNNGRTAQTSQNSVLMTRENQTSSSSSTGFGTTGGSGFGGGGGGFGGGGGGFGGGGFGGGGGRFGQ